MRPEGNFGTQRGKGVVEEVEIVNLVSDDEGEDGDEDVDLNDVGSDQDLPNIDSDNSAAVSGARAVSATSHPQAGLPQPPASSTLFSGSRLRPGNDAKDAFAQLAASVGAHRPQQAASDAFPPKVQPTSRVRSVPLPAKVVPAAAPKRERQPEAADSAYFVTDIGGLADTSESPRKRSRVDPPNSTEPQPRKVLAKPAGGAPFSVLVPPPALTAQSRALSSFAVSSSSSVSASGAPARVAAPRQTERLLGENDDVQIAPEQPPAAVGKVFEPNSWDRERIGKVTSTLANGIGNIRYVPNVLWAVSGREFNTGHVSYDCRPFTLSLSRVMCRKDSTERPLWEDKVSVALDSLKWKIGGFNEAYRQANLVGIAATVRHASGGTRTVRFDRFDVRESGQVTIDPNYGSRKIEPLPFDSNARYAASMKNSNDPKLLAFQKVLEEAVLHVYTEAECSLFPKMPAAQLRKEGGDPSLKTVAFALLAKGINAICQESLQFTPTVAKKVDVPTEEIGALKSNSSSIASERLRMYADSVLKHRLGNFLDFPCLSPLVVLSFVRSLSLKTMMERKWLFTKLVVELAEPDTFKSVTMNAHLLLETTLSLLTLLQMTLPCLGDFVTENSPTSLEPAPPTLLTWMRVHSFLLVLFCDETPDAFSMRSRPDTASPPVTEIKTFFDAAMFVLTMFKGVCAATSTGALPPNELNITKFGLNMTVVKLLQYLRPLDQISQVLGWYVANIPGISDPNECVVQVTFPSETEKHKTEYCDLASLEDFLVERVNAIDPEQEGEVVKTLLSRSTQPTDIANPLAILTETERIIVASKTASRKTCKDALEALSGLKCAAQSILVDKMKLMEAALQQKLDRLVQKKVCITKDIEIEPSSDGSKTYKMDIYVKQALKHVGYCLALDPSEKREWLDKFREFALKGTELLQSPLYTSERWTVQSFFETNPHLVPECLGLQPKNEKRRFKNGQLFYKNSGSSYKLSIVGVMVHPGALSWGSCVKDFNKVQAVAWVTSRSDEPSSFGYLPDVPREALQNLRFVPILQELVEKPKIQIVGNSGSRKTSTFNMSVFLSTIVGPKPTPWDVLNINFSKVDEAALVSRSRWGLRCIDPPFQAVKCATKISARNIVSAKFNSIVFDDYQARVNQFNEFLGTLTVVGQRLDHMSVVLMAQSYPRRNMIQKDYITNNVNLLLMIKPAQGGVFLNNVEFDALANGKNTQRLIDAKKDNTQPYLLRKGSELFIVGKAHNEGIVLEGEVYPKYADVPLEDPCEGAARIIVKPELFGTFNSEGSEDEDYI